MSQETATQTDAQTDTRLEPWQAGLLGGIGGAIAFGVMMAMMSPEMLETMIPSMYSLEGGPAGWFVHISHGAVLGVVFAALLGIAGRSSVSLPVGAVGGLAYGVLVWVALAVVVMPIWLGMPEMVPNVDPGSLIGHAIYGLLLGIIYASLK